jgi:hypothetical protein
MVPVPLWVSSDFHNLSSLVLVSVMKLPLWGPDHLQTDAERVLAPSWSMPDDLLQPEEALKHSSWSCGPSILTGISARSAVAANHTSL